MKSLLLGLIAVFSLNANAAPEVICQGGESKNKKESAVLSIKDSNMILISSEQKSSGQIKTKVKLYPVGKETSGISGETVVSGIAETQVQVDTFITDQFVLSLTKESPITAKLDLQKEDGELLKTYSMKCYRPDYR